MEIRDPRRDAVAADHRRRAAVRRRCRGPLPRARPGNGPGAVGDEPRLVGHRLSGHVRGRRAPVCRGLDRLLARRQLHPRADQGHAGHAVRVRAARRRDRPAGAAARAGQPGRARDRGRPGAGGAGRGRSPPASSAPRRPSAAARSMPKAAPRATAPASRRRQGVPPSRAPRSSPTGRAARSPT